jgi:hypothetical protein
MSGRARLPTQPFGLAPISAEEVVQGSSASVDAVFRERDNHERRLFSLQRARVELDASERARGILATFRWPILLGTCEIQLFENAIRAACYCVIARTVAADPKMGLNGAFVDAPPSPAEVDNAGRLVPCCHL